MVRKIFCFYWTIQSPTKELLLQCLQNVPDACNSDVILLLNSSRSVQGIAGIFLQTAPGACNLFMEKNRIQIEEKRPNKLVIKMYNCLSSE
ncbi:hypothetical protein GLYMA_08G264300v4 [Glycine max]|uniref:Uncharacterized protein n=1 Tax=Glycine max TaxID=3847 RepID=A0A0R0ISN6_SOYBN|nr:hypothetical protein JHK85_023063 [Glycine max]KAH1053200.1 hypothetical protein GYH30_022473 [Glycine max]KRH45309.1 hypothetical protein GLYMA_08G264300v4 [Glycine max]